MIAIASAQQSGTTPTPTTPGILVQCMAPVAATTAGSLALLPPGELLVGR